MQGHFRISSTAITDAPRIAVESIGRGWRTYLKRANEENCLRGECGVSESYACPGQRRVELLDMLV